MASRDIWSHAGTLHVRDLLASLLGARLLALEDAQPLYLCSPYLTDFPVFDNAFGQFQPLFRGRLALGERPSILFSEALAELSCRCPVRIVGVHGEYADAFLRAAVSAANPNIAGRYASELLHGKGLLCPAFYIEGSMNFTYSGVYRRDEKITAHTPDTPEGRGKIAAATLEFNRLWQTRQNSEVPRTP
jgi:hypothetical protein